jgi:hypothetical protein
MPIADYAELVGTQVPPTKKPRTAMAG